MGLFDFLTRKGQKKVVADPTNPETRTPKPSSVSTPPLKSASSSEADDKTGCQHQWFTGAPCLCSKCFQTFHKWDGGKCSKCGKSQESVAPEKKDKSEAGVRMVKKAPDGTFRAHKGHISDVPALFSLAQVSYNSVMAA